MWDNNNDKVQDDRFFENDCIEYRAVCERSLEAEVSSTQKLTFGIERLLSMPATTQFEKKSCEPFLSSFHKDEEQIPFNHPVRKCECCEEYKGDEFLSNFSKFLISEQDISRSKYAASVCEPNTQKCRKSVDQCRETVNYVTFGATYETDKRCSKLICKPLPLRVASVHLGQGDIISHQTIDSFAFPQTTTTYRYVESWPCDASVPHHIDKYNECSLFKTQTPSGDVHSLRSSNSVADAFNKSVTQSVISRRKRSWSRAVFSSLQRKGLEKTFQEQKYITKPDRKRLAATLGLHDTQVKVWFQNRRMKWRHMVKNTSLFSMTQNKDAGKSQVISPSFTNSEIAEMMAIDGNEETEDDDVIID
ncbi:homeobox protein BarH-like 2 [Anopheles marshallii]|uniref:homeobox protein BarH-like 2 n=1 Tax=Anopheles marshallii TaxID=1521116 RepID=UPI00237C3E09|nr:homeobox protein BarH-like 2 [Anopheles marshallii]